MTKILTYKSDVDLDYPICRPSLDLDFTQEVLDSRITFTRGSIGTRVNRNRVIETVDANLPRFDYDPVTGECKGLLIEESRQNLVRNNTAQGAVVGAPGTLPTNSYVFISPSGISREIVSIGTENGITYFDIRYYGVSASNGEISWAPQTATNTTITGGQTVTASAYLKVVSGSFSNISSLSVRVLDYNGASYLTESSSSVTSSSLLSSSLNRYSHTRTTTAGANGVVFSITLNKTSAGPVDITLRIGMPQIEVGAFATSVIPTSGSQVTRSADLASMTGTNFSSWFNQTEGTLYADLNNITTRSSLTFDRLIALTNSSDVNRNGIAIYSQTGPGGGAQNLFLPAAYYSPDGSYTVDLPIPSVGGPQRIGKSVIAYQRNNFGFTVSGAKPSFYGKGELPTCNLLTIFGAGRYQPAPSGYIKRLTYYPRRLKDNQLVLLTQ